MKGLDKLVGTVLMSGKSVAKGGITMLKEGEMAPDFTLTNVDGSNVRLSSFRGKSVVLYFYPKDDTPGCTKEACSFRDIYDVILAKGGVVIGISADSTESHTKFQKKYGLPFYLLSDEKHEVADKYGAWGEKTLAGKKFEGMIRSTFIIDPAGKLKKIFPKVTPEGHAEEVLGEL